MFALYLRDVRLALRSGSGTANALAFFLLLVLLVSLGVGPGREGLAAVAPGMIWVGTLLSCLFSLDRMFVPDHDDGVLEVLVTGPAPVEGIAAAKALAHWTTIGLPLTAASPFFAYLFSLPAGAYPWLVLSIAMGTPALSFIGMFSAALTFPLRRGSLLLSLLVLPMYLPTLILGVQTVKLAAVGASMLPVLLFLGGVTLIAVAATPFAAAFALRANLG